MAALAANGSSDPAMAAFKEGHARPDKSYAAAVAASPAGVADQPSTHESPSPPTFGNERIVDIIRREQHNQMQQARVKGTTTQAQKAGHPVPHGSGRPAILAVLGAMGVPHPCGPWVGHTSCMGGGGGGCSSDTGAGDTLHEQPDGTRRALTSMACATSRPSCLAMPRSCHLDASRLCRGAVLHVCESLARSMSAAHVSN